MHPPIHPCNHPSTHPAVCVCVCVCLLLLLLAVVAVVVAGAFAIGRYNFNYSFEAHKRAMAAAQVPIFEELSEGLDQAMAAINSAATARSPEAALRHLGVGNDDDDNDDDDDVNHQAVAVRPGTKGAPSRGRDAREAVAEAEEKQRREIHRVVQDRLQRDELFPARDVYEERERQYEKRRRE
jgi:hypothetical protein